MSDRPPQWHPSSPAIDPEQFPDVIEGPLTIIHCWAPWNPYDKQLDTNIQALPPALKKRFRFFALNNDLTDSTPITDAHHVAALPTLLCFQHAKLRGRFVGLNTPEDLQKFLEEMTQPMPR